MALQLIGEKDTDALRDIVAEWLPRSTPLEKRAIVAGLAHPPILADVDFARFSLETAQSIMASIPRTGEKERRDESFKVLRQGMGYALSVFVHHCPEDGFAFLRRSAAVRDADVAWIIRENLKKKRLTSHHSKEVEQVALILEEATAR